MRHLQRESRSYETHRGKTAFLFVLVLLVLGFLFRSCWCLYASDDIALDPGGNRNLEEDDDALRGQ